MDLLCIASNERDRVALQDGIADAYREVQQAFNVPVSAVVATVSQLGTPRLEALKRQVRRDGVLLFGAVPPALKGKLQLGKICANLLKYAQHEEICQHWRGC